MSILIAIALAQAAGGAPMRPRLDDQARAERRFQMMDANHDGVVSKSEFLAAHRMMRERRMERREMRGGMGTRQGGWQGQGRMQPQSR